MPRFFVDRVEQHTALLTGADAAHAAKSLRMRVGEELVLCDQNAVDHRCLITAIGAQEIMLTVLDRVPNMAEPLCELRLYVAIPKGDKLELIVQKAVELGVSEITPVLTARCVSRPDPAGMRKRVERLNRVALEAAKQCGRGRVPRVREMTDFNTALAQMGQASAALLCYEKDGVRLCGAMGDRPASVAVMTGSEGGFSPEEAALAQAMGVVPVTLGRRILRAETAPLYALSVLSYLLER